ncbi:MAG: AMP-binding protein [Pseudomonadota bacterium]
MNLTHILQRTAREYPERPGFTDHTGTCSWLEMLRRCEAAAGVLGALGLVAGDRLAVLADNSIAMVELLYAPCWIGAVSVPINLRWAQPEQIDCLRDCTPVALAADRDHAERALELQRQCQGIETLIFMDDGPVPDGFVSFREEQSRTTPVSVCHAGSDDLAMIVYTGGTTGRSKGVMLSHGNIVANATCYMEFGSVGDDRTVLLANPFYHTGGCSRIFVHTFMVTHVVIMKAYDAVAVMENIQRYRATDILLIAAMGSVLVNHPKLRDYDLSSLSKIYYGAAPIPPSLLEQLHQVFPQAGFSNGYGMTEAAPIVSNLGPAQHDFTGPNRHRLKSVGRPAPHVQVRIVDEFGAELPAGKVGEICVRGPNIMLGYWNMPDATADVIKDGWYATGDGGYRDADGYLYVVDRIKDMIITGGENVYSIEVERVIDQLAVVRQCAVVGLPDPQWGERVYAVVSLHADRQLDYETLLAHCREHIAGYKCPKGLAVWPELPLSGAKKILKRDIRDELMRQKY